MFDAPLPMSKSFVSVAQYASPAKRVGMFARTPRKIRRAKLRGKKSERAAIEVRERGSRPDTCRQLSL